MSNTRKDATELPGKPVDDWLEERRALATAAMPQEGELHVHLSNTVRRACQFRNGDFVEITIDEAMKLMQEKL